MGWMDPLAIASAVPGGIAPLVSPAALLLALLGGLGLAALGIALVGLGGASLPRGARSARASRPEVRRETVEQTP